MSTPTKTEGVSLQEHFKEILAEKDKAVFAAMSANKEAVIVAERNAEKWRDSANEWRSAMSDREKRFIERNEFVAYKESMDKTLSEIKKQVDIIAGRKEGLKDGWGYLVGAIGLIIGALGYLK